MLLFLFWSLSSYSDFFFPVTNFPKPKVFFRDHTIRNRYFFSRPNFPKPRVSKPRSFETEISHSASHAVVGVGVNILIIWTDNHIVTLSDRSIMVLLVNLGRITSSTSCGGTLHRFHTRLPQVFSPSSNSSHKVLCGHQITRNWLLF